MKRARGDQEEVAKISGTYVEGELAVRRSLEDSFSHFSSLQLETRWPVYCVSTGGRASCAFDSRRVDRVEPR